MEGYSPEVRKNTEEIQSQLLNLGITSLSTEVINKKISEQSEHFKLAAWADFDSQKIKVILNFKRDGEIVQLESYNARLYIKQSISNQPVNGVDVSQLEQKMKGVDWFYAYTENAKELEQNYNQIANIQGDIQKLTTTEAGLKVAAQLWINHVPFFGDLEAAAIMHRASDADLSIERSFKPQVPLQNAYEGMVSQFAALQKNPHDVLEHKNLIDNLGEVENQSFTKILKDMSLTEQEIAHTLKQYAQRGIGDALTENVINQMRQGVPLIQHNYDKQYQNGDSAKATFHLQKSSKTNLYFLNKFDLTVKPDGKDEISRTFYINDPKRLAHVVKDDKQMFTTYTFKGAVNFLAGRAVQNAYTNLNGDRMDQWNLLSMVNGKAIERTIHPNYGFKLEAVTSEYKQAVQVLSHTEYGKQFHDSLKRGNLESTKFVEKDGKVNNYLVSTNIQVGCLNVYTKNPEDLKEGEKMRLLSPEEKLERGFISQEFAQKIRARMDQIEAQKETNKNVISKENEPKEKVSKSAKQREKASEGSEQPKKKTKNEAEN